MPEAGKSARIGDAGLLGINLPGVQVENLWFAAVVAGAPEYPARQGVWVLAEVAPAGSGYRLTQYFGRRERKLRQLGTAAGNNFIRLFRAAGNAVVVVPGGEY